MITPISNHVQQALNRLITQYADKPLMRGLLASFVTPVQEIEGVLEELNVQRAIDTAVGVQLDGLGSIVGIARNNLGDEPYRIRIKARILINISEGEPEIIIAVFALLTGSSLTVLQEYPPCGVGLFGDGVIPSGQEDLFASLIKSALAAGVRLDAMGYFDSSNPFSFDGLVSPTGGGFGSIYDGAVGGMLGGLYGFGFYHAFAGPDPETLGYSSVFDSAEGGRYAT